MTSEDFRTLRGEAKETLGQVQRLPGFAELKEALPACPELALSWPWHAVQLVLAGRPPGLIRYITTTDGGREAVRLEKRPDEQAIAELANYAEALEKFSRCYLFGAEWAVRALHDAVRLGGEVKLPRGKPDPWIKLPTDVVPLGDLEAIVRERAPGRLNPTRDRAATWEGALDGTALRLRGETVDQRRRLALHRARKYFDAAVNRKIQPPHSDHVPFEPSDSGDYARVLGQEEREGRERREARSTRST